MLWCSLELPQQAASNEYPQHRFTGRNKKDIMWIPLLSGAMNLIERDTGKNHHPCSDPWVGLGYRHISVTV